ncbi:DUF1127 domain-containing protein [Stappia indica]|uniref:DUF1127 domain-containing protein n=1 Tax=Stappia indica TaxID=538381 RepID=UPI001CD5FFCF|nr:DUF1127 domain-containing protein [Stappia indica]MCA1297680.1 DUF1127 domain-containing protein [Stappia indica]
MTHACNCEPISVAPAPTRGWLTAGLDRAFSLVAAAWRRRKHRREIAALLSHDDYMLKDIGLSRTDVLAAVLIHDEVDPGTRLSLVRSERQRAERARKGVRGA